jgi:hypothetical protein
LDRGARHPFESPSDRDSDAGSSEPASIVFAVMAALMWSADSPARWRRQRVAELHSDVLSSPTGQGVACEDGDTTPQLRGQIFRRKGQSRQSARVESPRGAEDDRQKTLLELDRWREIGPRQAQLVPAAGRNRLEITRSRLLNADERHMLETQ